MAKKKSSLFVAIFDDCFVDLDGCEGSCIDEVVFTAEVPVVAAAQDCVARLCADSDLVTIYELVPRYVVKQVKALVEPVK